MLPPHPLSQKVLYVIASKQGEVVLAVLPSTELEHSMMCILCVYLTLSQRVTVTHFADPGVRLAARLGQLSRWSAMW